MDRLKAQLAALKERFDALSQRVRIGLLAGVGALVALTVLLLANGSEPDYDVLYGNLSPEDAGRIVERLRGLNVPYQLDDGGRTIRVPEESVHEARLSLANEGLPRGGGVGFEIFDTQRFGESDFSEQVQFRRALEGELQRTIGHLAGVESARVHLVLPQRTLFTNDEGGASASVALHLSAGWRVRDEQVRGVTHLVASSVPGLTPDRVTIVDGEGRPLGGGHSEAGEGVSEAEDLRSQIERSKQRSVQQLLDASLGPGVAVVRVSAEVDVSRQEDLQETYDPERTATRSFEVQEERDPNAEASAQGVPGAASNLPGGAAAESAAGANGLARRSERRNFEVTKMVRRSVRPAGSVSRLTVAVVVDGIWEGEGDARSVEPREAEELARIRSLVISAAGINEERGDAVTIEYVPFATSANPRVEIVDPIAPYLVFWPYAASIVGLLLFIGLMVFGVKAARRFKKTQEERALAALSAGGSDPQRLGTPQALSALGLAGEEVELSDPSKVLSDYEQLRALALEVARRDPEMAARAVRGWLSDDRRAAGGDEGEAVELEEEGKAA